MPRPLMDPRKKKSKTIKIRVSEDDIYAFKWLAKTKKTNMSDLIRDVLQERFSETLHEKVAGKNVTKL